MLPYFDDDASVSYFDDIQRLETGVYKDLIERLDREGQLLLRDDTSPNYTHAYTELDDMGNLLLSVEQIDEILPELNRSRMLLLDYIEEADRIYQQLKEGIRKSRKKEHTKIELAEDTLRDDFERVLIKKESLFEVFKDRINQKSTNWRDIIVVIDYKNSHKPIIQFKSGQEVLKEDTFEKLGFKGIKRKEPNILFQILESMHESNRAEYLKLKHSDSFRTGMTRLRNLLKKHAGLTADPFEKEDDGPNHKPKFKIIIK